mmetsp:Transcript_65117/g.121973  ORF Transcript_65117/g.121973 Transcript_65117/m.121973 type:complete len:179 (-) Transcript_65117:124-660(-)
MELLNLIENGASENVIQSAVKATERVTQFLPFQSTIASPLLSDTWLLVYTSSGSIAGKTRPSLLQTNLPPVQLIDVEGGKAENSELVFGVRSAVEARLVPQTPSRVGVEFTRFKIGPLAFAAPNTFTGFLEVTYLDDTMRISRGDKGSVFVLLRQDQECSARKVWRGWKKSWVKAGNQ